MTPTVSLIASNSLNTVQHFTRYQLTKCTAQPSETAKLLMQGATTTQMLDDESILLITMLQINISTFLPNITKVCQNLTKSLQKLKGLHFISLQRKYSLLQEIPHSLVQVSKTSYQHHLQLKQKKAHSLLS